MNDVQITICGNTTAPAEIRFTSSGAPVASFTVAHTPRTFDRAANEWKDGETMFLTCSAWRQMAENVAETLSTKGMRVIVQGRLKSRSYETREGEKRTVFEIDVEEVGPSLTWATARVTRNDRSGAGQSRPQAQQQRPAGDPWAPPAGDPWAARSAEAPF